ncbi:PHB depolymerase family esterase [Bacillaceae bacterium S4-13-58]
MKSKRLILVSLILVFTLSMIGLVANASNNDQDSQDTEDFIMVDGLKRTYLMHIPSNRDQSNLLPLVIVLHGGGGSGAGMAEATHGGFNVLADEEKFVVGYPDAVDNQWNDGRSKEEADHRAHRENIDDVGFISALIDELIKEENVDPQRVYVTGMSNGAMMTYRLAGELSEKIAAAAPVDGNIPENLVANYTPSKPVSMLVINNIADPLMPWQGGDITGPFGNKKLGKVLSVRESIKLWVKYNQCSIVPTENSITDNDPNDGTKVRRIIYSGGLKGTEVILYAIEGGGHTWPAGSSKLPERVIGKTSQEINANEVIWNFFKKHVR